MIKVLVNGCNGRMGRIVCELAQKSEKFELCAGFDRENLNLFGVEVFTKIDEGPFYRSQPRPKNEIERAVRLFNSSERKTCWRSSLCDNNMHLTKQKIINFMPVTGGDSASWLAVKVV